MGIPVNILYIPVKGLCDWVALSLSQSIFDTEAGRWMMKATEQPLEQLAVENDEDSSEQMMVKADDSGSQMMDADLEKLEQGALDLESMAQYQGEAVKKAQRATVMDNGDLGGTVETPQKPGVKKQGLAQLIKKAQETELTDKDPKLVVKKARKIAVMDDVGGWKMAQDVVKNNTERETKWSSKT